MAKKQVVVIGLGRFGSSLARSLTELGHEVMALDRDMARVESVTESVTHAAQVDATDEDALREMGVADVEVGAVAISSDLKSSILITVLLKRLGVRTVIAKAQDTLHGEILTKVGADRVIYPERETAIRLAHGLAAPDLVDYLQVTPGYGIATLLVPPDFAGLNLTVSDLRRRFAVATLVLRREGEVTLNPTPSEILKPDDLLVLAGQDDKLEGLAAL
jgi:trk system potassium uptake protein TrkA